MHEAVVLAVVADLLHLALIGPHQGTIAPVGKARTGGLSRYASAASGERLSEVLGLMAHAGLAVVSIGKVGAGSRTATVVSPGARLVELIALHRPQLGDIGRVAPPETIILKARKPTGGGTRVAPLLGYEDNQTTNRMRAEMQALNAWLGAADLAIDPDAWPAGEPLPDMSARSLRRVFNNGSFSEGGRLYGGVWVNMASRLRGALRITGEPVMVADFASLNARLLYALEGHDVPADEDLYSVAGFEGPYREAVKVVMNAALFHRGPLKRLPNGVYIERAKSPDAKPLPEGTTTRSMMAALAARHPLVAHHFSGTEIGWRLMYRESCIVVDALKECRMRGLVALPIHDAVVVPESRAEEARAILEASYRKHTGMTPSVKLKRPGEKADEWRDLEDGRWSKA